MVNYWLLAWCQIYLIFSLRVAFFVRFTHLGWASFPCVQVTHSLNMSNNLNANSFNRTRSHMQICDNVILRILCKLGQISFNIYCKTRCCNKGGGGMVRLFFDPCDVARLYSKKNFLDFYCNITYITLRRDVEPDYDR